MADLYHAEGTAGTVNIVGLMLPVMSWKAEYVFAEDVREAKTKEKSAPRKVKRYDKLHPWWRKFS